MSVLDRVRAAGWRALAGDGPLASTARQWNDKLGRPLASPEELADRRAFAAGYTAASAAAQATTTPAPAPTARPVAPVIIYFLDKQRRDVPRLTEILDSHHIPYKEMSLEDDPAAQAAVRRDSAGYRLPVVFIAGDCVGGRVELLNLANTGELARRVFG
ncbi:MAG: glutaredoxin domain-containing protein [Kofleriaceae bacterium]